MDSFPTLERRSDVIRAHKERGGSVAAVLPIHTPRALFRAFDILPVEVWGPPGVDAGYGAAHLQLYICSIVRNALGFLQSGGLDSVDFLVVPHACDALQGLGSILVDFIAEKPVLTPYLPRGNRLSDEDFLAAEFASLFRRLEAVTGRTPSEADLLRAVQREEAADGLLAELHRQRAGLLLGDLVFYRLVRSREYLPAEIFTARAQTVLAQVAGPVQDGIPILLSGIVPEPMDLLGVIAEMGGFVAADDLACCGRRLYAPGESKDPFRRMAQRLLGAPPDPTRGSPIGDRLEFLLALTRARKIKGVVFYSVKFCEPEQFDLPILRQGLQAVGIPSIVIETDLGDLLSHRLRTRLEAFMEMIQ